MAKKRLKLNEPKDVRALIKQWIMEVRNTGELPFQNGGVIVQMLNVWLKSYELEKVSELEKRIQVIEADSKERRGGG